MVFKNKLFFSSKKSGTSSPDGSSSPQSAGSNSSIRSDKKKPKSSVIAGDSSSSPTTSTPLKKSQVRDSLLKKLDSGVATSSTTMDTQPTSSSSSPLLPSSLNLTKIKTRSGPLPQESFFSFREDEGSSDMPRSGGESGSGCSGRKKEAGRSKIEDDGSFVAPSPDCNTLWAETTPVVHARSLFHNGDPSLEPGFTEVKANTGDTINREFYTPENFSCDNPKESESPRFQAILRVTSAPRKRLPADIKSFSHELNSKGVRPFPFWKPRGRNNLEEVVVVIRAKFDKAKEEVDSDLAIFAADLVGVLEKTTEMHPEWKETIEDLLVQARRCAMTSPGEFWLQCEGIVQELDDRRQELPPGILKQLHTRMLFILTRCTRLLQFHKETGLSEDNNVFNHQSRLLHSSGKLTTVKDISNIKSKSSAARLSQSQEQGIYKVEELRFTPAPSIPEHPPNSVASSSERNRIASWKKLPSALSLSKEVGDSKDQIGINKNEYTAKDAFDVDGSVIFPSDISKQFDQNRTKHRHKASWGYWGDTQSIHDDGSIICRICEEEVPTLHIEEHSRICAIADRCDEKDLSVNDRLLRISETLEKMIEPNSNKDNANVAGSPDATKISYSSLTEDDALSQKLSDWSRRGSEDMLDCLPEVDNAVFMDDLKSLPSMAFKSRFGPKSDHGMGTSSAGSMTPRSPLLTPRTSHIDLLLAGKCSATEHDDIPQISELAEIARFAANAPLDDECSISYILSCLEDLRVVIGRRKFDALTVETFGICIEKLIREKYIQLCERADEGKLDITSTVIDEDTPLDDDVVSRSSPLSKDRISIDDFEIIKPISRGAFGRVFLAKKRTTGDLFAIKVLRKADMIRKNAVESILAERDILISVRNPFVVRFFYSFTCRENLYLVMEYLNGGDLYSLLRKVGCLDEDYARIYIAELVLALEYLHSLRVVHRDLKPDNLLIAHDGHIKLTDFGLSKVGLINSTDDLSGPAVSVTSMLEDDVPQLPSSEHQRERRKKRSAVGTPDYLAPEILLGTGHGATADWWSVGVILFEMLVGIPPFNSDHPQKIFDNILNRNVPWPKVPDEMSYEAQDLIDKLLTEDPHQRLGARGASEVKEHVFFKDINWDSPARQKAAFVPSSDSAFDTSYFTSRYTWEPSDGHVYESDDVIDAESESESSSERSHTHDEERDKCGGLAEFDSASSVNYSFSNFSFKNLSQLASINYDLSKGWKDDPFS